MGKEKKRKKKRKKEKKRKEKTEEGGKGRKGRRKVATMRRQVLPLHRETLRNAVSFADYRMAIDRYGRIVLPEESAMVIAINRD